MRISHTPVGIIPDPVVNVRHSARVHLDNVGFSYGSPNSTVPRLLQRQKASFDIDVSLLVEHNTVACLLGLSGSGKTSVLKLIAGLLAPSRGRIYVNGALVSDTMQVRSPGERGMCIVFQTPSLLPYRTAIDNVLFAMNGIGSSSADSKKLRITAQEYLEHVGMLKNAEQYPHELSMGQQQRISIARAFASGAAVMLLDEPFANLDVESRAQARSYLVRMIKCYSRSVILVTHDAEETMLIGDKVYVMDNGKIAQSGTPRELYTNPCNLFVARFFGQVNVISARTDSNGKVLLPFPAQLHCAFLNSSVIVGIRNERIHPISPTDDSLTDCVTAVVIDIKFFGAYDLVQLMFCGGNVFNMCCATGACSVEIGEVARVQFDWSASVVFESSGEEVCLA